MGLWDTLTSSNTWNTIGNIANVAGSVYDIYSGIQNQNLANRYANIAAGTAAKQDQITQEMWDRQKQLYWPLEDLNVKYMTEDLQTLRPAYQNQVAYQAQRLNEQLANAKELNPMLDETEKSLLRRLTEGEDVLAERLMNQATADVGASYSAQREQDQRAMGLAGINPNSGQYANYLNRMGTSEALAESTARTQASRQAEELALSRQAQALNYRQGAQLPTYSYTPSVNTGTILSGLGSTGSSYTGLANMYNTNAQQNWSGANYLMNQLSGGSYGKATT
nr:MAG TPA: hypothetical protein [Caudoviricetes sp.]